MKICFSIHFLLDDTGRPHVDVQPKLLCEPHSIATVYEQSIIGVGIVVRKRSHHYLPTRGHKIPHALAERVSKPDIALVIEINAGDMRSWTGRGG